MPEPKGNPDDALLEDIIVEICHHMGKSWTQDDQLLQKFFPIDPAQNSTFLLVRQALYKETKRYGKRWTGIPVAPDATRKLFTPLTKLMNSILSLSKVSLKKRLFLNTHGNRPVYGNDPMPISPGIFLSGVGKEFAKSCAQLPRAIFSSGISTIEVSLDSDDPVVPRNRLAVHMHRLFLDQANRRFAFGLVITQTTFTVHMFDHSGVVSSTPCNYHDHPEQFYALIIGLASEGRRLGCDVTIFQEDGYTKIRTMERRDADSTRQATYYIVKDGLFQFPYLVGRGTICWQTSRADEPQATYVIKDAWVAPSDPPGRESEAVLLQHARDNGVVNGVVQLHHFEEVLLSSDTSDLDSVVRNRQIEGFPANSDPLKMERIHTRMVMSTHGKTLDEFETPEELLLAYYDAVVAHRNLYETAGILHRDISPRNILINPDGAEGNRGILIDFDHAIRIENTSPYSTKRQIGTYRFMSRNALSAREPHTYFDDLESFYYVLCWILGAYEGPGVHTEKLPLFLSVWDTESAFTMKDGQIGTNSEFPISPWFGNALVDLSRHLCAFFRSRLLGNFGPTRDYDDFESQIKKSIQDLEAERKLSSTDTLPANSVTTQASRENSKEIIVPTEGSDLKPPPRRPRWTRVQVPFAPARPRRSTARYGVVNS